MEYKDGKVFNPPLPNNYAKEFALFEKGEGVYLVNYEGKKFLDFGSGIAVNSLGYSDDKLAEIAAKQMKNVIHVSALYMTQPTITLAEKLIKTGNFSVVQFQNSGSEANEAALKFSRIYGKRKKSKSAFKILAFDNSFHGRTMGALSATGTKKYRDSFAPLPEGFYFSPFNDIKAMEKILDKDFCAVIVEPVQGEGGINPLSKEFATALMKKCKELDILIIADEIQMGIGRLGYVFGSEIMGLIPDIVTLSKPLAAGLPLSAALLPEKVNNYIQPGDHGGTLGGGPVTCAVASYVWDKITDTNFLQTVKNKGAFFSDELENIISELKLDAKVKGMGLLQGLALENIDQAAKIPQIMTECYNNGLLILRAGTNVLRMAPPLVIKQEEIKKGLLILKDALKEIL